MNEFQRSHVKCREIIADNLKKAGCAAWRLAFRWGPKSKRRRICLVKPWEKESQHGDGKRFIVRTDEKLTAGQPQKAVGRRLTD